MWGWIGAAIGSVLGLIPDTVRRFIGDVASAIYGYMHSLFGFVGDAWYWVWRNSAAFAIGIDHFMGQATSSIWVLFFRTIPAVVRYMSTWVSRFLHYFSILWHWIIHELDALRHWIAALIDATRRWVISHIYNPLFKNIVNIWNWIFHRGEILWYYLTHPDKFVDLIWNHVIAKLEHEAWNLGARLGRFFLSLFLHNLKRFVILMEDILDAVL